MPARDLKRYVGHPNQLSSLRQVELETGQAKGMRIYEVSTQSGLRLDILADNGMDLGALSYKGINLSFLTKNGYQSPERNLPYETEFVHTFPGGMLYTCGLRSVGPANRDGDEWHPLHGRYHSLSAEEQFSYREGDSFVLGGTLRETSLFGHALELRRKITIPVEGSTVILEDTLTNQTPQPAEFMMLYHMNFGYPMLSEAATLELPKERETSPRDENARAGLGQELRFSPPIDGEPEQVFFHEMKEHWATLRNPEVGLAATVRWSGDTLPRLAQWKSMASGDYVLGIEPTNNYIMGRAQERENGTLQVLDGFSSLTHRVVLEIKEI